MSTPFESSPSGAPSTAAPVATVKPPNKTTEAEESVRIASANTLVKNASYWAGGAALLPVPALDLAAIAGVQVKLINDLCKLYGVKFSEHRTTKIISVLLSSVGAHRLLTGAVSSVIKVIPLVGSLAGLVSLPLVASSATYALGKVFIKHFESGGTLLNFDPESTKKYFQEQFAEAKKTQPVPAAAPVAA